MQINIRFPEALDSSHIETIADVQKYYDNSVEYVRPIATRAFVDGDQQAWEDIQHILYRYNTNDVERLIDPLSLRASAERMVRAFIVNLQNDNYSEYSVPLNGPFDVDSAIEVLKTEAMAHRINTHPLFGVMERGLNKEEIRVFLDNYYVNNRLFHLHLATLSLSTPLEKRVDLAANFYDEMGCGDYEQVHPVLFLKNYDFIGESQSIDPTPGTLHLLNTKVLLTHLASDHRKGFGGFGFIEVAMPGQMKAILKGLKNSDMTDKQSIFWDLHISIDERHGESWFHEMRELISNEDDYKTILAAGIRLLNARSALYDDVLATIELMRGQDSERKAV